MKRIKLFRKISQILFLVLLAVGIYMDLRMVIVAFLPTTLIFGNFFCSWACPFGTTQELFGKLGSLFMKKKLKMPKAVQNYMQYLRYIIFIVSMTGVAAVFFGTINAYGTFLANFNIDAITNIALSASAILLGSLLIISMFFERPFCNYLCGEAAKYGVLNMARIFTIKRSEDTCIDCKQCDKACPMNITVSDKDSVRNGQCINCFECVSACPKKDTLSYGFTGWNIKKRKAEKQKQQEQSN